MIEATPIAPFGHVSVDLETWGVIPGCDIRSIGAVEFDPISGLMGREFYVNIYDGPAYGLHRDPDTIAWWEKQSEAAQQALVDNQQPITRALKLFSEWWPSSQATFWANGPHFDEPILGAGYRATGIKIPWHYRSPRCFRTICEAAGGIDLPFEGVEHNALADAKHQARCIIEAYQRITTHV